MFTVTYTHKRKNKETPFYFDANDEARNLVQRAVALTAAAAGYLSSSNTMSDDFLSNIVVVNWIDQAARDAYESVNKEFLEDYRASRIAYEASEGGVTTTETTST